MDDATLSSSSLSNVNNSINSGSSNGQARPPPHYLTSLASGALAGLSVDLSLYPLDTLKTRLQSSKGFWASGGFKGVYQGISSVAAGSAPGAAIFFVTYESLKKELLGTESLSSGAAHMMAASAGEVAACLVRVPTEVVKSRFQAGVYGKDINVASAISKILAREGPRGLWKGYGTTVAREIPFTCIQFPLYERLKLVLLERYRISNPDATSLPPYQAALVGSFSGAIAAGTTTPLDVVKTRLMLAERSREQGGQPVKGVVAGGPPRARPGVNQRFLPTLLHVWETDGIKGLYRGVLPRIVWIGLGGAVFLGSFEVGVRALEGERI
ncbi:mitochondrial carrier [Jaminaea rosea]|uniref:Mitochondrial carrier n=1 Tax=Jaminaea rosea TaxID=1569628 RepID=A0A316UZ79_9BASI|nr:mitochondrial carrier [Jaminaea rosea]PWN29631.1 mitochondrial carrier [Jaminaea rosea]